VSNQITTFSDFDSLIERHQGNVESALQEIEDFVETLQRDMQVLERQVSREDSLTVASVAYRLKSTAKRLGIDLIHQSAVQIETSARKNRLGQLAAEIDLMKYQVELFTQSAQIQKESLDEFKVPLSSS
jgi:HPt (histidine-containing phosphotransfer) domain-containing protein